MGDVIDFESRKNKKESLPEIEITFTPDDDFLASITVDPLECFVSFQEDNDGRFMEHIANLIEVCSYNVDWTTSPDWHRDMYQRALQFYDDHYANKR